MFFSRKNNASSGQAEINVAPESNRTLSETTGLQSAVNMQIQDMKELSKATAAVIDKVKAMKIDDVNRQLQSIDSRLKNLEGHIEEQDKAITVLKSISAEKQSPSDPDIIEKAKTAASSAVAVQLSLIVKQLNGFEDKIAAVEKRQASDESALQKHLPAIESIDAPLVEKIRELDAHAADPQLAETAKKFAALDARLSRIDAALSEQEANRKKSYQLIESMEQALAEKLRKASLDEIAKRFETADSRLKNIESHIGAMDKSIIEKSMAGKSEDMLKRFEAVDSRLKMIESHLETIDNSRLEKSTASNSEDIAKRFESVDSRLKSLESNMISLNKKVSSAQAAIKIEEPTIQKPATSSTQYSAKAPEIKPLNPIQKSACTALDPSRPNESHILETTMDREKKDTVKEAISSYEMRTITNKDNMYPNPNHKPNILASIVNQIIPAAKKEFHASQKEKLEGTMMHNASADAIAPKTTPKNAPTYQDLKEGPSPKPANISKTGDVPGSAAKLSLDIARAKQLVREKKYTEATEIYLMLINALEDSKSDPSLKELAPAIDDLYECISSSLLSNLSTTEEKEVATMHKQNKPI